MGRRIVAGAALVALVGSLSACMNCPRPIAGGPAPAPRHEVVVTTAPSHEVTVVREHERRGPPPMMHHRERWHDCNACYTSEAERNMWRLRDCLPEGEDCGGCNRVPAHCVCCDD